MDDNYEGVRQTSISLKQRNSLTITGVLEILSFDEDYISLSLDDSKLDIEGNGMKILAFSNSSGEVTVTGHINAMIYNDSADKPFKKPLFRRFSKNE